MRRSTFDKSLLWIAIICSALFTLLAAIFWRAND